MPAPRVVERAWRGLATAAIMGGIRGWFLAGERLFPARAAQDAERVWLRVPPPPPLQRRERGVPAGERLAIEVAGRPIEAFAWGAGPVVLCVHGWHAWWQQFSVYIEPLVAAGFRVVAWDAPSHGASAPGSFGAGRSGMPELTDAILAVADAVGGQIHGLIAHSGGSLAALQAIRLGLQAKRLVFVSTSVAASDQIDFLQRTLGWGPKTLAGATQRIEQRYEVAFPDWELVDLLPTSGVELPPLLMLHHRSDAQTPLTRAELLAERWPGARLVVTDDFDHHRILWAPSTVAQAVDFLAADGLDEE